MTPEPPLRVDAAVAGVVLAGGDSRRMGTPKHAIVLPGGLTMLEHVVRALLDCVPFVAIVGLSDPAPAAGTRGVVSIPDLHPGRGPLAGVHAALTRLDAGGFLIAACDQPLLDGRHLRPLLERAPDRACCLAPAGEGRIHPLPVYLPRTILPRVEEDLLRGHGSLRRLIESVVHERVVLSNEHEPALRGINTPEELEQCRAALGGAGSHEG